MANEKVTIELKTRLNKDEKEGTTSKVTIELDDDAALQKFALRSAGIAWQAIARAAGVIPATDTVKLSDLAKRQGGGFKATPESLANRIGKMSADDYRATLEKLMPTFATDKAVRATIDKMVKAHLAK